jgi:hypothetical protein
MAFHLEMYKSSIVSTSATSFIQVTSLANGVVPTLLNGFQVPPNLPKLGLIAGYSTHMTGIKLQAPSMLPFPYPAFAPINRGSAFESPARVFDLMANPIQLNPTEELDAFAAAGNNTETAYVAILFTDGIIEPRPAGRLFTVHATASTTLTAGAFTQVTPGFDTPLPAALGGARMYAVVGARYYSATAAFFQLMPAQEPLWRPGGVGVQAYDQLDPPGQRAYGWFSGGYQPWGVWMKFQQNVPPTFNCFATSADTAEEFWLDLVAIGAP